MSEAWRDDANCKGEDPAMFILERGVSSTPGKKFCEQCPVTEECYAYGVMTNSVGIWGGVVLGANRSIHIQDGRLKRVAQPPARRTKVTKPVTLFAAGTPKKEQR